MNSKPWQTVIFRILYNITKFLYIEANQVFSTYTGSHFPDEYVASEKIILLIS